MKNHSMRIGKNGKNNCSLRDGRFDRSYAMHLHRTAFGAVLVSKARAFDASRTHRLACVELTG
jgi:hypothetical protein